MREIIFGTRNEAKIDQINGALQGTDIVVIGIPEGSNELEINEDGKTAQENAHKKARAYADLLGKTVFAMDNALYFKGLDDSSQPSVNVRRFKGDERQGDSQMLEYYRDLIAKIGGEEVDGSWNFGICIARPDGTCSETTIVSPRKFVTKGSNKIVDGYPLESIQKDPVTGKIISDMNQEEQNAFWMREIGKDLQEFVLKNLT